MEKVRYTQADGTEFDAWVIDENTILVSDNGNARFVRGEDAKRIARPKKPRPVKGETESHG